MRKGPKNTKEKARASEDALAEAVTGWATNRLFPMPNLPNRYFRLPWRRIVKRYGVVRGALFLAKTLAIWPFELIVELARADPKPGQNREADTLLLNSIKANTSVFCIEMSTLSKICSLGTWRKVSLRANSVFASRQRGWKKGFVSVSERLVLMLKRKLQRVP
jgi:hypothetical protein